MITSVFKTPTIHIFYGRFLKSEIENILLFSLIFVFVSILAKAPIIDLLKRFRSNLSLKLTDFFTI